MRRTGLLLAVAPLALVIACSTGTGTGTANHDTATLGAPAHYSNWPNFHNTASKSGVANGPVTLPLHTAWHRKLDGAVWSEPVIGDDVLIAATERNSVYGLNPQTGKILWHQKLALAEPGSSQPCGDIDPIGITGSPAFDPATGSVFVVDTSPSGHHTVWSLSAKTGKRNWHRNGDVDRHRDMNAEQQRAALVVIDHRVIVTYGAHAGDCGNYVGLAVSIPTNGRGPTPHYAVPNARGAGMWGPAGPVEAYDGNVLTPTANGSNRTGGTWDHSDGVIELDPTTMHYVRGWAPTNWEQGDADDLSLGSTSPVRVAGDYVVGGKRGEVWLLAPDLGGVGGQLDTLGGDNYCNAFGGIAARGDTAIIPCKNFSKPHSLLAVTVSNGKLHQKWDTSGLYGAPVIAGQRVFVADLDSGSLKVLSLQTGHVIASIPVGPLATFPSEVVDGNHVFVPTLSGITALRGS
ncbi:MAG TPA: PQQ-binding-like beta-propeller repeat protein [Mycobacteriales bacterium]|nr:PQQ-binding-like beta-propeller repeat protein [Mycobacteriales bacterium]